MHFLRMSALAHPQLPRSYWARWFLPIFACRGGPGSAAPRGGGPRGTQKLIFVSLPARTITKIFSKRFLCLHGPLRKYFRSAHETLLNPKSFMRSLKSLMPCVIQPKKAVCLANTHYCSMHQEFGAATPTTWNSHCSKHQKLFRTHKNYSTGEPHIRKLAVSGGIPINCF